MSLLLPARRGAPPSMTTALAGCVLVAMASVLYYGRYIDCGLNFADDGHYAQAAFELLSGTDPHELRFGYGLMWFKLGEALFRLAGPGWGVVQGIFYTLIAVTSVLLYLTVLQVTRRPLPAALGAAVAIAVPAFPATAFYALCVLLNVFCQSRMALRWRELAPRDAVAPAMALSLTFQIRPDFGFIFAVPLLGLLLLGAAGGRAGSGAARFAGLAGAATAAFAAVQAPIVLAAVLGGYLDLILVEVVRYPLGILRFLQAVWGGGNGNGGGAAAAAAGGAGTLLARPPLSALWLEGPWSPGFRLPGAAGPMAVLVYVPVVVVAGFALLALEGLRAPGGFGRLPVRAVALGGALATLPHYFLFRPDLAHVANFMPGYLVPVCVLAADLPGIARRSRLAGTAAAAVLLVALYGVAVYLWVGLTVPGTGSIAAAAGRTEPFTARNGVAVRVSPGDRVLLEGVRDAIETASRPGDRIVCVPFCPGMAFMTGRRMLFRDYYVDDSFLLSDPGWIDRAIELTRRARPPVVVVVDWAINGTEISRFQNWARPYIQSLEEGGYRRLDLPGVWVYRLPEAKRESKPDSNPPAQPPA